MTANFSTFPLWRTFKASRNTLSSGLLIGTLVAASFTVMSGAAQANCAFNGPNCVTGTYPDLEKDAEWLDAAVSQSDAGANGANADNLPLPARTAPTPAGGILGKNPQIIIMAGKKH